MSLSTFTKFCSHHHCYLLPSVSSLRRDSWVLISTPHSLLPHIRNSENTSVTVAHSYILESRSSRAVGTHAQGTGQRSPFPPASSVPSLPTRAVLGTSTMAVLMPPASNPRNNGRTLGGEAGGLPDGCWGARGGGLWGYPGPLLIHHGWF